MKASELVYHLQVIINEHGDLPVVANIAHQERAAGYCNIRQEILDGNLCIINDLNFETEFEYFTTRDCIYIS